MRMVCPIDIRILPEALLPIAVAQHHHRIAPGDSFITGKEAAQCGMNPQRVERVGHHLGAEYPIRRIGSRHIRFRIRPKAANCGEGSGMLAQGLDPALGKEADLSGAVFDPCQPILLRKGQWAQHDGVHQGEDRRVCPDPQRQRENRGEGKSGRLSQLPQRESQVIQHLEDSICMRLATLK